MTQGNEEKKHDDAMQINSNQEKVSNKNIKMRIPIPGSEKKYDEMLVIPIKKRLPGWAIYQETGAEDLLAENKKKQIVQTLKVNFIVIFLQFSQSFKTK